MITLDQHKRALAEVNYTKSLIQDDVKFQRRHSKFSPKKNEARIADLELARIILEQNIQDLKEAGYE